LTRTDTARINLGVVPDFTLGKLHVVPMRRQVIFDGQPRTLEPRVMQVLVALAEARPSVVSRDQLAQICWGGLHVGDDAINRCILALRHLARDLSPTPFAIETIARVGYALVEAPESSRDRSAKFRWPAKRITLVTLAALILAFAGTIGWLRFSQRPVTPATIAVLPFRNLSAGDPYFAEGVGEEILDQLAREPEFRVAGRMTSAQFSNTKNLRDAGQSLGVEHVLEGSVRKQGDRVRVSADLVRVRDGIQLWSGTFDGQLNDIFEIQQRIGEAVAGAVKRRLVRTPIGAGMRVSNGQAYDRYLAARSLMRSRNPDVMTAAVQLLREAVQLDPGYAPAWSSLAEAVRFDADNGGHEDVIAALPQARSYAWHALKLAPDLPEAHGVLGMLLEFASPEAQAHLRRSSELDPNNAEYQIWLGIAHETAGEFDQELASYRRAHELDPLWFRPVRDISLSLAEFGKRQEAEAFVKRVYAESPNNQNLVMGRIAGISGDYPEAVRRWTMVEKADPKTLGKPARLALSTVLFALHLPTEPPPRDWVRPADLSNPIRRVWMNSPPTPEEWRKRNRSRLAAEVYNVENVVAAKLMLNAGRPRELVATYVSDAGLLGIHQDETIRPHQLNVVPLVAVALRQTGRSALADRLLSQADAVIRTIYRRGQVPFSFDADAAAIWAAQGRRDEALAALERAMRRGWTHAGTTDLPELGGEPAFAPLRADPRFHRIEARLSDTLQRQRQEILHLR